MLRKETSAKRTGRNEAKGTPRPQQCISVIGILAAVAIPTYQNYVVRAQVSEGVSIAAPTKARVAGSFLAKGDAPVDRTEAGLTANATDTAGKYVASVNVDQGAVIVTYGNDASAQIANLTFTMTPYETNNMGVVWRCGSAPEPTGLSPIGTASGGNVAVYNAPTVPGRYLPASCRP